MDPRVDLLAVKLAPTLLPSKLPVSVGDDVLVIGPCDARDNALHRGETTVTKHKRISYEYGSQFITPTKTFGRRPVEVAIALAFIFFNFCGAFSLTSVRMC